MACAPSIGRMGRREEKVHIKMEDKMGITRDIMKMEG